MKIQLMLGIFGALGFGSLSVTWAGSPVLQAKPINPVGAAADLCPPANAGGNFRSKQTIRVQFVAPLVSNPSLSFGVKLTRNGEVVHQGMLAAGGIYVSPKVCPGNYEVYPVLTPERLINSRGAFYGSVGQLIQESDFSAVGTGDISRQVTLEPVLRKVVVHLTSANQADMSAVHGRNTDHDITKHFSAEMVRDGYMKPRVTLVPSGNEFGNFEVDVQCCGSNAIFSWKNSLNDFSRLQLIADPERSTVTFQPRAEANAPVRLDLQVAPVFLVRNYRGEIVSRLEERYSFASTRSTLHIENRDTCDNRTPPDTVIDQSPRHDTVQKFGTPITVYQYRLLDANNPQCRR